MRSACRFEKLYPGPLIFDPISFLAVVQKLGTTIVDARETGFCLGLTDEMGLGVRSVFYQVEVSERGTRRRRGTRIRGIGEFADLRQLCLVPDAKGW